MGVTESNGLEADFSVAGIVSRSTADVVNGTVNPSALTANFYYQGTARTLAIDSSAVSGLFFNVKDLRDNSPPKEVYRVTDVSSLYMFVKQFWSNTNEVENFWWVDAAHVLELTRSRLNLYVKGSGYDDWNGDNWTLQKSGPRGAFFSNEAHRYGVSNAQNGAGWLYKIRGADTNITIWYISNIVGANFDAPSWAQRTVGVVKLSYGGAPSTSAVSSYTQVTGSSVVSEGKFSHAVTSGVFRVGFALGRGLMQWTINVNSGQVVTGYGHVGLDGMMYGGCLPLNCCGGTGFNKAVQPLTALPAEGGNMPNAVYGSGPNLYFVMAVSSIVYAISSSGGVLSTPLNNNYVSDYQSLTFATSGLYDVAIKKKSLEEIFDGLGNALFTAIADVVLAPYYYMHPKMATFCHISHSLGQYAYVYRTCSTQTKPIVNRSTQEMLDAQPTDIFGDMSPGEMSFNRKEYQKSPNISKSYTTSFWFMLMTKGVANVFNNAVDFATSGARAAVDALKGKSNAFSGLGRQAKGAVTSAFSLDNIDGAVNSAISTNALIPSMSSKLVMRMSLSMFYSISDTSEVYAGPGFTNINVVGQCVAQSVSDTQTSGARIGFMQSLLAITMGIVHAKIQLAELIFEMAIKTVEMSQGAQLTVAAYGVGSGAEVGIPEGQIVGTIAMAIIAVVEGFLIPPWRTAAKVYETILHDFTSAGNQDVAYAHASFDVEDLHTYGDKPLSFFYPVFGATSNTYINESVATEYVTSKQKVNVAGESKVGTLYSPVKDATLSLNDSFMNSLNGDVASVSIACKGGGGAAAAPAGMAVV